MSKALPLALLLLLLVLLAGGAFLLTDGERRGPSPLAPGGLSSAVVQAPVGSEDPGVSSDAPREGAADPASTRTSAEPVSRGPRRGERLAFGVRVQLSGAEPEELERASVTHLEPRADGSDWAGPLRSAADPAGPFAEEGVIYDAGIEGQLYVPRFSNPTYLFARLGERVGFARVDPLAEEVTLALGAAPPLTVEVRAASGGLLPGLPIAVWRDSTRTSEAVWTGRTDDAGRVAIPHAARLMDLHPREGATFRLGFHFPTRRGAGIAFQPESFASGLIALVAPALGSLTVRVEDEAGIAHEKGAEVVLSTVDPGSVEATGLVAHPRFPRPIAAGEREAHFEFVETRLLLEARVKATGRGGGSRVLEGPGYEGDARREVLRFGTNAPVIVGSLIDKGGVLVAARRLRFSVEVFDKGGALIKRYPQLRETDDEGVFRVPLRDYYVKGARRELRVDFQEGDEGEAVAPLPSEIPTGDFSVGRLQLDGAPLVVAGSVLGADGEALEGAELRVKQRIGADGSGRELWVDPLRRTFTTDEGGSFAVRARPSQKGALRVEVRHPDHRDASVAFELGDADLRVPLEAAGRVSGRVRLPAGAPLDQVLVRLTPARRVDPPHGLAPEPGLPLGDDGTFEATSLEPGTYALEVRLLLEDGPIQRVEGLEVRAGEPLDDGRTDVDLRERLAVYRLLVRGAENALEEARIYPASTSSLTDNRYGLVAPRGRLHLLARTPEVSVDVWAPGHAPQRIDGIEPGDRTIRLERGPEVRVSLTEGDWDLPGGSRLQLALTPWYGEEPDGPLYVLPEARGRATADFCPWGKPLSHVVDSEAEVVLHVPEANTYALSWTIRRQTGRHFELGPVEPFAPQYIEVGEDGAAVTATLTPKDLGRALSAMK